jgi:hypothetical protein
VSGVGLNGDGMVGAGLEAGAGIGHCWSPSLLR